MSEQFLATAFVRIRPNLTGFATELRREVKARTANIKSVPVPVVPKVAGFAAAINTLKTEALAVPVEVPVLPDITKFRSLLVSEVETASAGVIAPVVVTPVAAGIEQIAALRAEISAVPVEIPVLPDASKFRELLIAEVEAASAGVTAPIVVTPVGGIAKTVEQEVTKAATSSARKATGEKTLIQIENKRREAINRISDALNAEITVEERDAIITRSITTLKKQLTAAEVELQTVRRTSGTGADKAAADRIRQLKEEIALAETRLSTAPVSAGAGATAAGASAGVTGAAGKQTTQTEAAAAATRELTQEEQALIATQNALTVSQAKRAEAAKLVNTALAKGTKESTSRKAADAAALASSEAVAASEAGIVASREINDASIRKLIADEQIHAINQDRLVKEQIKALPVIRATAKADDILARAELKVAEAQAIELASIKELSGFKEINIALSAANREIKALEAAATSLNSKALLDEVVNLKRDTAALAENIAARKAEIKSAAASATQFRNASRGAAATGLSLLGVRGATLAAGGAFLAGAAAIAVFAKALGSFAGFQEQLNVFQATTGATADEMERVSEVAKELGADITLPSVSARDAATAMTELSKAGLSVEDSIAGARGVLELAIAANIDFQAATEIAASALNAFGLSGKDAVRVADDLANAANAAQGSISDFGIAMSQVAAVGRQVGLSLEDTTVFLTVLAKNGLRGSDAGTSLRTALIRLINPSKKAKEEIAKLGLEIRDAEGNIRPDVFVNFGEATRNLSPAARDAAAALIFGQDAIRAVAIASRQSIQDLIRTRKEITKTGTASEVAGARAKGLGGSVRALSSNLETVGISIGQSVAPAFTNLVNNIDDFVTSASNSDQVRSTLGATITAVGDSFHALGAIASVTLPPTLALAGGLAKVATSIGVTEILAGVAAFKLLNATLKSEIFFKLVVGTSLATQKLTAFIKTMLAAETASAGLRLGMAGIGTSLVGLVSSTTAITLALAAVAAGLVFLATRESATARTTRELKDATDAYSQSLTDLRTAQDAAAGSAGDVLTQQIALTSAILAARAARNSLATSKAPKDSLERLQLQNQLAISVDNVRIAEQRLAAARKQATEDAAVAAQVEINLKNARLGQVSEIVDLGEQVKRVGQFYKGSADEVKAFTESIRERARAEAAKATPQSLDLAKRLRELANLSTAIKAVPTLRQIRIVLKADSAKQAAETLANLFGPAGEEAHKKFVDNLLNGFKTLPQLLAEALIPIEKPILDFFALLGVNSAKVFADATTAHGAAGFGSGLMPDVESLTGVSGKTVKQITNQIAVIEDQITQAQIEGNKQREIALRKQEDSLLKEAIGKSTNVETTRDLRNQRLANQQAVESIEEGIASDAEEHQNKIKEIRDKADQAVLRSIGIQQQKDANREAKAELDKSLKNDIDAAKITRNHLTKQIALVKKKVKDEQTAADQILSLENQRIAARKKLASLLEDQRQAKREAAQTRRDRIAERLDLNVQIAATTGNRSKEIAARKAQIANTEKLLRMFPKGSLQRKRLILQLRQEQKELRDLKKEREKANDAFKQATFAFLQKQQGFAANLLTNLIPIGAVSGTVGGTTPIPGQPAPPKGGGAGQTPKSQFQKDAAVTKAGAGGPTRIGQTTQNQILRQMLHILQSIHRGTAHPEAQHRQHTNRVRQETGIGGV